MKINHFVLVLNLFLLSFPAYTFPQYTPALAENKKNVIHFKGMVMDEASKLPLSYVNIGILNEPIGTVSDEKGEFSLALSADLHNKVIQISLIGYHTQTIPVKEIRQSNKAIHTFNLSKSEFKLKEVVVSAKKLQEKVIGRRAESGMLQATFNRNKLEASAKLGTEIGLKIDSPNYPAIVKDFNWYISSNNFEKITFRINLYSLKHHLPDSLLLKEEIYVAVENFKTGWNKVDLEPFRISVNSDFVISLQWVDHQITTKENPVIWIPGTLSAIHLSYLRDGSQDKWQKYNGNISYFVTLLY